MADANESVSLGMVEQTVSSPLLHDVLKTQPKHGRRVLQWTCILVAVLAYFFISSGLVVANVLQDAVDVFTDALPNAFVHMYNFSCFDSSAEFPSGASVPGDQ